MVNNLSKIFRNILVTIGVLCGITIVEIALRCERFYLISPINFIWERLGFYGCRGMEFIIEIFVSSFIIYGILGGLGGYFLFRLIKWIKGRF